MFCSLDGLREAKQLSTLRECTERRCGREARYAAGLCGIRRNRPYKAICTQPLHVDSGTKSGQDKVDAGCVWCKT